MAEVRLGLTVTSLYTLIDKSPNMRGTSAPVVTTGADVFDRIYY